MKPLILALVLMFSATPHPTKKHYPPMPKIELDQNCMSYWRETFEDGKVVERTWIEPNWHDMSEPAKRRCQLFI